MRRFANILFSSSCVRRSVAPPLQCSRRGFPAAACSGTVAASRHNAQQHPQPPTTTPAAAATTTMTVDGPSFFFQGGDREDPQKFAGYCDESVEDVQRLSALLTDDDRDRYAPYLLNSPLFLVRERTMSVLAAAAAATAKETEPTEFSSLVAIGLFEGEAEEEFGAIVLSSADAQIVYGERANADMQMCRVF